MAAQSVPAGSVTYDAMVRVLITSYGFLHGPAPEAHLVLDVRHALYDPHVDPALRQLTGLDPQVRDTVLATEGARDLISATTAAVMAMLPGHDQRGALLRVAIGCAGGRHRSVVIATEVANLLGSVGVGTEIDHRDINRPVVSQGRHT